MKLEVRNWSYLEPNMLILGLRRYAEESGKPWRNKSLRKKSVVGSLDQLAKRTFRSR